MKMTFRWYGKGDSISLSFIRQIPNMSGVVTAVYDCSVGEAWNENSVKELKNLCDLANLKMEVIESVPVHEDIKLGKLSRDRYIENYIKNIEILGKYGVKCICYNFMPVFDWLRTDLKTVNIDGSNALSYKHETLMKSDPKDLRLPGWDESYTHGQLNGLLDEYKWVSHEALFDNLVYFLKAIMPACQKTGINMAIHPDDPPWDMFGLPRIISKISDYDKLFTAVSDSHNGITFCTGSLGAGRSNNLINMIEKYHNRIYFAHIRQLKYSGECDFTEAGHLTAAGDLDISGIVKALVKSGFDGYVRPDHGRNIWGEDGKPGYGLYDRALGAAYLNGLFEVYEKELKNELL